MSANFDRRTLLKGIGSSAAAMSFSELDAAVRGQGMGQGSSTVKALVFDTFGTVVDWRSSVIAESAARGKAKGINLDWADFADRWRLGYVPAMDKVRKGTIPWTRLDDLHRMILEDLLKEFKIKNLTDQEIVSWSYVWRRLKPWPDSVDGLTRLKKKYVIAPLSNGNIALMFGVGFLTRPLGAVVIGIYGDRTGRRPAMVLSFALMGAAILGLVLTPSYTQIGIAAPVLLVIFRLVQGFALGGEVGPSTAFLVEAAPPHRRGLYVSLQYMTQDVAVMAAGMAGFLLSTWLSPAALDAWGWRIAFLIGLAVVPVGLYMRHHLPETLRDFDRRVTTAEQRRVPVRLIVLALVLLMANSIYLFGVDYITTYAQDSLHLSTTLAFGATVVIGFSAVLADPLAGLLSDRIGRKPVMIGAAVILVLLLVPAYMAMTGLPSVGVIYGVIAILGVLQAFLTAPALVAVTESLPKAVRSGSLAILYAVAISLCGGTTQFAIKALTDLTGSPLTPAWYMTGAVLAGAIAMALMQETAPARRGLLEVTEDARVGETAT